MYTFQNDSASIESPKPGVISINLQLAPPSESAGALPRLAPDLLRLARAVDACVQINRPAARPGPSSSSSERTVSVQNVLSQVFLDLDLVSELPTLDATHFHPLANLSDTGIPQAAPNKLHGPADALASSSVDTVDSDPFLSLPETTTGRQTSPSRQAVGPSPTSIPKGPVTAMSQTAAKLVPLVDLTEAATSSVQAAASGDPEDEPPSLDPAVAVTSAPTGAASSTDPQAVKNPRGEIDPREEGATPPPSSPAPSGPAGWVRRLFGR